MLSAINHEPSRICIAAERAFLKVLSGSCATPIAGLAALESGKLHFRGLIAAPDGSAFYRVERRGSPDDAERIGQDAAQEVLKNARALMG
jgi:hydroxymethylbilane synthase